MFPRRLRVAAGQANLFRRKKKLKPQIKSARRNWADQPLVMSELIGWRVWMVFGSGEPIMYSPYLKTQEQWKTTAKCPHAPDHVPPHPSCKCGVYAVECVLDIVARAHYLDWGVRIGDPKFYADNPPSAVFGRVKLKRAVREFQEEPDTELPREVGVGKQWRPQLRAASCEIDTLFVPPQWKGQRSPEVLAAELSDEYGVPSIVGYPEVTDRDRATRPHWLDFVAATRDFAVLNIPEPMASEVRNVAPPRGSVS